MMKFFEDHDPMPLLGWTIIICACLCMFSCTVKEVLTDIIAIQRTTN